jgi:serine/threonine-protein kinase
MTPGTLPAVLGGRYRLERRLGHGGMAAVHLGHDTVLDRPVALKLLADGPGHDDELRERFLREGRFAAKLSHPHVVGVFDTGEEDGRPYIVMEYVEGSSLAEELARRGAFDPDEVVELGRQACAGLGHAHDAGLVHRDVKPENLLLRADGVLKVADFGIARGGIGATITQAGTLLGTASYMAPEVADGRPATAASDVYSLGAVLYELLAGVPPRRVESLADLSDEQPLRPLGERVPDAPPALAAAITRCLEREPLRRPQSARELVLQLEDRSGAPTRPLRSPVHVQRARPARRIWIAVASAAALVAFALALSLGLRDDPPAEPPPLERVPAGSSPAEDARNLADWLRESSR